MLGLRRVPRKWFRACERRAVHLPARLNGFEADVGEVLLVELGLTGGRVNCARPVPIGINVQLELQPPNLWDPLRIAAKVVWCEPRDERFFIGLEFELGGAPIMGLLLELMTAGKYD
jgi:hypothetical protein